MHKLQPSHDLPRVVKKGDLVTIHYVGKFSDGTVFETTHNKPLRLSVGEHATIQGIEEGIIGMKIGEKKRIIVSPEKAYGKYHKDLTQELPLSKIPMEITPQIGMVLTQESKTGRTLFMRIIKVNRDSVVFDMNHPFAGKTLVFDIVIMAIH
ncbi:MAG: FKBP-type peptidyl-prolyl cis-trans isomerase [Candidatus Woesearchaeota archaeon]|jgi:peptidylprolyl isomerase